MPTMNISLPEGLAAFVEQEVLRRAVMVGIEDWKAGRLDDRPIDEILNEIKD